MMTAKDLQDNEKETGWDRVGNIFKLGPDNKISDDLQDIPTIVCISSIFGFLLGGQFGIRIGADHYTRQNKLTVYKSQMHAQREFQSAKLLGFTKYGSRWGWRMGVFAGLYSFLLAATSAFRDKNDAVNYVFAGASTGAIYKLFGGWRSMVVASVLCAGVSAPIGLLAQAGNTYLIPEEYKKQQQEKKDEKKKLWNQQLKRTDTLIENMEKELNTNNESTK